MRFTISGLILFILWAFFARYWFLCRVMHQSEAAPSIELPVTVTNEPPRSKDLELIDADTALLTQFEQFGFPSTKASPTLTKNNLLFLNKLARLLQERKDTKVVISGAYLGSETYTNTLHKNLGLARAHAIAELLQKTGIDSSRMVLKSRILEEKMRQPILFTLQDSALTLKKHIK
jgi:hypothetical protein